MEHYIEREHRGGDGDRVHVEAMVSQVREASAKSYPPSTMQHDCHYENGHVLQCDGWLARGGAHPVSAVPKQHGHPYVRVSLPPIDNIIASAAIFLLLLLAWFGHQ